MPGMRVVLIGLDDQKQDAVVLASANYQIPPLWLFSFTESDLTDYQLSTEGDARDGMGAESYPVLSTDRDRALSALQQKNDRFISELPGDVQHIVERWFEYLNSREFTALAIDPYELWLNSAQPEELRDTIVEALELQNRDELKCKFIANLSNNGQIDQISLAGFGW